MFKGRCGSLGRGGGTGDLGWVKISELVMFRNCRSMRTHQSCKWNVLVWVCPLGAPGLGLGSVMQVLYGGGGHMRQASALSFRGCLIILGGADFCQKQTPRV